MRNVPAEVSQSGFLAPGALPTRGSNLGGRRRPLAKKPSTQFPTYLLKLNPPAAAAAAAAPLLVAGALAVGAVEEEDTDGGWDGDIDSCFCDADSAAEAMSTSILPTRLCVYLRAPLLFYRVSRDGGIGW